MTKNSKALILILIVILVLSLIVNIRLGMTPVKKMLGAFLVQPVLAENIYPMFFCPCCGLPLDKKNICCGMAQERIDYIDSLVAQNLSEKDIILTYVKKYGLSSFVDNAKQAEAKNWLLESAPAQRPIIALDKEYFDMGDVSQKGGMVSTYFEIKNDGRKDLIINKLDSSCGCTSASIIYKGVEGPRFAMAGHGIESPTGWQVTLAPGDTAQLKVYYDPSVHANFRGAATREIIIFSSDPIDFEKKVTVDLNQID